MTTQELIDLRICIMEGRTQDALIIIDELDGMSTKDILLKIESYLMVLLVYLITNQLERRLTNSWAAFLRNSIRKIQLMIIWFCYRVEKIGSLGREVKSNNRAPETGVFQQYLRQLFNKSQLVIARRLENELTS